MGKIRVTLHTPPHRNGDETHRLRSPTGENASLRASSCFVRKKQITKRNTEPIAIMLAKLE